MKNASPIPTHAFERAAREAVYAAIRGRRDIRHFLPDAIPDEVLARILRAGYQAPSVGFSQPWNFILVRSLDLRQRLQAHVEAERLVGAELFEAERRGRYLSLKLEGILESPINLCVTCDRERFGPAVLGRNTILDADIYSAVAAVQNIWLAARAEGVGLGWVSLLRNEFLSELLALPSQVVPVAYLCMGYPASFPKRPTLETQGWLPRIPLSEMVFENGWAGEPSSDLRQHLGEQE